MGRGGRVFDIIKDKIGKPFRGPRDNPYGPRLTANPDENAALIATALEHGIYGMALWDKEFNLIAANSRYSDLHKIPKTLLTPGTNLLTVMQDLKTRGVLTADTDPVTLKAHISQTLATTGQLTSAIKFSDGTFLEISAERMSNGCIVAYLRNATRERILVQEAREKEKRTETYANAIAGFTLPTPDESTATTRAGLHHITKTVATLLPVDWCVVWTRSNTLNEAAAASTYQHATGSHLQIENMILPDLVEYLAILETSQVIAIDDLDKHAFGQVHGNRAPLDDYAYASIDIPFRQNGRIMGVLSCLDTQRARNWSAADKLFAAAAASHIGSLMSSQGSTDLWDLPAGEVYRDGQAAE